MTTKPNLTRIWAVTAPGANIEDPDVTSPGKFAAGWGAEIPPFENFNFLQQLFTQGLAYINENGLGEWDTDTTYPISGIVRGSNGNYYIAVLEQNGNDPISDDGTNWILWYTNYNDVKSGRKNYIINGNFDIWQRGTSLTLSGSAPEYLADRWLHQRATQPTTITREAFTLGQSDVPGNPTYFARVTKTAAEVVATVPFEQRVEDVKTLSNQIFTFSFWAKSDIAKTYQVQVNQNFGVGGSATVVGYSADVDVGTTWQRFTITGTMPSVVGKTIGTGSYLTCAILEASGFSTFTLDVARAQLEEGPIATDFEYRPIAEELSLAKRYYERKNYQFSSRVTGGGDLNTPRNATGLHFEYSEKRTAPTVTITTADHDIISAGIFYAPSAITVTFANVQHCNINVTHAVIPAQAPVILRANKSTPIEIDAEL